MPNDEAAPTQGAGSEGHPVANRIDLWNDGWVVNQTGCLINTYQVNVPGPDSESPNGGWPLYLPLLVKLCNQAHMIADCMTLNLSNPSVFRSGGETLISDPEEARLSLEWTTSESRNDPQQLTRSHLLDREANRGGELVESPITQTTREVERYTTRSRTEDRGNNVWLWCAAIMPTNEEEWSALCSSLPATHDHYWTLRDPRSFARALGLMCAEQMGQHQRESTLTHKFEGEANKVTNHSARTVFHGPVTYVEDPYRYLAASSFPSTQMLGPLFVKRLDYRDQREYRFVIWDETESSASSQVLRTSPALMETTVGSDHGEVPVPPSAVPVPRKLPSSSSALPIGSSLIPPGDSLTESFFALLDDPHINHLPRALDTHNLPMDLQEKTAVYASVDVLRNIVGRSGNRTDAAAAAWHAEPYVRSLCSAFEDPIGSIRLTPDNFIVIEIKFPEGSTAHGKIAIGPNGIARHKIGRGSNFTDATDGKSPHYGWPHLQHFDRTLEEHGLPRRTASAS